MSLGSAASLVEELAENQVYVKVMVYGRRGSRDVLIRNKMKLSDYCTIKKEGKVFIDLDTGWLLRVELHGMLPEYAQIFMRRLSKKRRLNDEDELMDAEVDVPNMEKQAQIAGAIITIDEMVICMAKRSSLMMTVHAMTNDSFYLEQDHYAGNLYGHLNEYRFLLIDDLMKI